MGYATKALGDLYGTTLNGLVKGGIRLSYSKNPLGVRTPTNTTNQAFGGSGSFSSLQEAFSRQGGGSGSGSAGGGASNILSIDTSSFRPAISRRDREREAAGGGGGGEVTSPTQYFASSPPMPPPRFFSPPPSSGFGSAAAAVVVGRGSQGFTGSFSPFGSSTPPEVVQQQQQQQGVLLEIGEPFGADPGMMTGLENARGG